MIIKELATMPKKQNSLKFLSAMQFETNPQWWSNLRTQF